MHPFNKKIDPLFFFKNIRENNWLEEDFLFHKVTDLKYDRLNLEISYSLEFVSKAHFGLVDLLPW